MKIIYTKHAETKFEQMTKLGWKITKQKVKSTILIKQLLFTLQGGVNMKVRYDKEEDILMIQLAKKKVDDAYESENMIVHVDKNKEPVLLEIFDAKNFLKETSKAFPQSIRQQVLL